MEHALQHRERVGVQDFVLLEDFRSEAAFIDNLRKRFRENIIYVSTRWAYHYIWIDLDISEITNFQKYVYDMPALWFLCSLKITIGPHDSNRRI